MSNVSLRVQRPLSGYSIQTRGTQTLGYGLLDASRCKMHLFRAARVELGLASGREQTPVLLIHGLAVVTNTVRLPGLVEGFKVEDVNSPRKQAANAVLVVLLCILSARLRSRVVGTAVCSQQSASMSQKRGLHPQLSKFGLTSGPSGFTVQNTDTVSVVTSHLLNV